MSKFRCPHCQNIFEMFRIDGYAVGDRLLEGVMFDVKKQGDTYVAYVEDPEDLYITELNIAKWEKEVAEYVTDMSDDAVGTCPNCGFDIIPDLDEVV